MNRRVEKKKKNRGLNQASKAEEKKFLQSKEKSRPLYKWVSSNSSYFPVFRFAAGLQACNQEEWMQLLQKETEMPAELMCKCVERVEGEKGAEN